MYINTNYILKLYMKNFLIWEDPREKIIEIKSKLLMQIEEIKSRINKIICIWEDKSIKDKYMEVYKDFVHIINPYVNMEYVESLVLWIKKLRENYPNYIKITDIDISDALELHKINRIILLFNEISWEKYYPDYYEFEKDSVQNEVMLDKKRELLFLGTWIINEGNISDLEKIKVIWIVEDIILSLKGGNWNISGSQNEEYKRILRKLSNKFNSWLYLNEEMFVWYEKERKEKYWAFVQPRRSELREV